MTRKYTLSEAALVQRRAKRKKRVLSNLYSFKPHKKQQEIIDSTAKRKIIITGRRFGKTTLVAYMSVKAMLAGRRVVYGAPIEAQCEAYWKYCKDYSVELEGIYKNEVKRLLEYKGGAIRCKSVFNADGLRGDYADLLILDEYSFMDRDVWEVVVQPMLLDSDGDVIFISTPNRKNHCYQLYLKALADTSGRWQAWHGTTQDNPHLSQIAINELTHDMTSEAFQQEIMAEFLEGSGQVFHNIRENLYFLGDEDHKGHRLVMGIDWGMKRDSTVCSIGCADCCKEIELSKFQATEYPVQRDLIRELYVKYNPEVLAEANSMGLPNIQALWEDNIPVEAFTTTHASKSLIIRAMQLALEQHAWKWLDIPWATYELEAYEMKMSSQGNVTYSAPSGLHDDSVIARMIMLYQAQMGGVGLIFSKH